MLRVALFIFGLIVIAIGVFIGATHILFVPGFFIIVIGIIIFSAAFTKHHVVDKVKNIQTEKNIEETTKTEYANDNPYKCKTCNGSGEVWGCTKCGRYAKIRPDGDDYELYCEVCEKNNIKYDIMEITCPSCDGHGYF